MKQLVAILAIALLPVTGALAHEYSKAHSHCHGMVKPATWKCADGK